MIMMIEKVMINDYKPCQDAKMIEKMTNLAKTPLRPAPRTSVVRGPPDLKLKYENA